jgi:hypothetical protein
MKLYNKVKIIGDKESNNTGLYKGYKGDIRVIKKSCYHVLLEATGNIIKFPKRRVVKL